MKRRGVVLAAAIIGLLTFGGAGASAADPVIAAAGDIACDPNSSNFNWGWGTSSRCRQRYTSDLLVNAGLARVLALGDEQYYDGALWKFQKSYDASWGRVKAITRPVPGNHEYDTWGASGYFDYFGSLAGARDKGYYSFDVGAWHIIALNSNCSRVSCAVGSRQETWLRADLAAHPNKCVLAFWHHPRYGSGYTSHSSVSPFWKALYAYRADVVLAGHAHFYERFARLTGSGTADSTTGIRSFIVGTGGASHQSATPVHQYSKALNTTTYGVLKLTLHPTSYTWRFVPEAGKTYTDSGWEACR